jgi:hypothetical protein
MLYDIQITSVHITQYCPKCHLLAFCTERINSWWHNRMKFHGKSMAHNRMDFTWNHPMECAAFSRLNSIGLKS